MIVDFDIRLPNISGATDREQLAQIRSYLYQMAGQLQFALGSITQQQETVEAKAEQAAKALDAAASPAPGATFNAIKSLIIKSADIVDAYYEEINRRLEGQYVAQSAFGSYAENTAQSITENADGIQRVFDSLQTIESELDEVRDQTLSVQAYVRTGRLYYDDNGFPVYGLEIGQENTEDGETVFRKYARFTSGKLSFYDNNDTEVAYFSDYKMYITNAHITGNLTLGEYELDTSDGLEFKWVGG